ncbi:hypothetical protein SLEP1_g13962 [Rubroshorea leprosula]|uniref:Uncharacterized protein n=1 Tax=Rubroshorea leprosula TaxID=152421 RepID=A0AAV5IT22_9ROSI|nr:hypothetical protein SLEP1_g13962 [Rubroshorea leprosula]
MSKVKVRVADQAALIDTGVSELRTAIAHKRRQLADIAGMLIQQSTVDCTKTPSWKARVFSVE